MSSEIEATLNERGSRYGTFADNSMIAQAFKKLLRKTPNWSKLTPAQQECLDMEASKNSRILTGDPTYRDNWIDKIGYNQLVLEMLDSGIPAKEETSDSMITKATPSATETASDIITKARSIAEQNRGGK